MRLVKIAKGEYYHVYLRGNNKQVIFHDDHDRARFLFLILTFQSPHSLANTKYYVHHLIQSRALNMKDDTIEKIANDRFIELVAFTLMSNHFHLIVYNKKEKGLPSYMQRVLTAYTKYYNTKYGTTGHLFQGPYQYRHIEDEKQLAFVSAYVHRNVSELNKWKGKEEKYPWSSMHDYVTENRFGPLLAHEIITETFRSGKEYRTFVSKSGAKAYLGEHPFEDE